MTAAMRMQAAIEAVAEVGNPTVVATLTVIAALLPMLFVSGLMGPYMAPIPANASAAMLFSFFVAMVVAPWLMLKLTPQRNSPSAGHEEASDGGRLGRLYRRFAIPIVRSRRSSAIFLGAVGAATVLVCVLFVTKNVTVKLLPFDNKSELDVVLDLPEGASLEDTERTLFAASEIARQMPEAQSMQAYAGTAAPFNFNGLVRHYYMRSSPELGELQVNLLPKSERSRSSHAVALDLRQRLKALTLMPDAVIKVVEVPPGPPVLATLLAEIYGPDAATRRAVAQEVKKIFNAVPYIVDVDDSYGNPRPRLRISIDQDRLEFFGVEQSDVYDTISMLLGGVPVGYSHRGAERDPIEIVIGLPKNDLAWTERLTSTPVPANVIPGSNRVVELGDVVRVTREEGTPVLFRRDGHFADMVTAEMAGAYEAPIYGMLAVDDAIATHDWGKLPPPTVSFHGQPTNEAKPTLLWDGEWEITYVTFRDMGAAFAVAILGIYILVVAQFGSFRLPLVILTPIPLTLIGIVLGHWLFRGAVYRDLDDRIHRARRYHRAQLDPARRFHPSRRRARQDVARNAAASGRGAIQAHPSDRALRHDRRGDDPARSDLPRAGDLAPVRAGLLDAADRSRHSGDLRGASRCRSNDLSRQVPGQPHVSPTGRKLPRFCV